MKASGLTDKGQFREKNQDSFSIDLKNKLFIVADGMGGHFGGEIASGTTVTEINNYWQKYYSEKKPPDYHIRKVIHKVNKQIFNQHKNMGTTLELLAVVKNKGWFGHIGDSRIYLLRQKKLELITNDHTKVKELLDAGELDMESARHYPFQHAITRALGIEAATVPDVFSTELQAEDMIIMCSDGLTGDMAKKIVSDEEITEIILSSDVLADACEKLVEKANDEGGPDNITVVIVKIEEGDLS